jgi:hypothetical protein
MTWLAQTGQHDIFIPAGMSIQFRILMFYSKPKEQLQKCLCLKKSAISLPAVIGTLGSPLGPHLERDQATNLYFVSTTIAITDESDHQISFKESVTSLSAVIRALDSPLGPHPKSDLVINLNSCSTPIVIMDESDCSISLNCLNKSVILLSVMIRALGSPLRPYSERDLTIDLYSISIPIAIKMILIAGSISDDFKKSTTLLQEVTKA